MANTVYMSKTGLIGGEATKLDSIDGAGLADNDAAFVNVANVQYIYRLDADSGAAESSPNIIAPDTNPGDKRWILQSTLSPAPDIGAATGTSLTLSGLTASLPVFTDGSKKLVSNTKTGTGKVVMDTSPTLVTPVLGAASGTSLTLSGLTASLPVFTDGSKKLVSKSVADTLTALGIGGWTDYSSISTVVGWSSFTTKRIWYYILESITFVFFTLEGTSNSDATTFTVPYMSNSNNIFSCTKVADDNPNLEGAYGSMTSGSNVVTLNGYGADWTSSGTKRVSGQFFYSRTL
jgi:hypothetical protein